MWDLIRWAVFWILGGLSLLLIIGNWLGFIGYLVESSKTKERRGFSFAPPFLCGVFGALVCFVCPSPNVWRWAWLPPLLDPSISLILICLVLHVVARIFGLTSPFDGPDKDEQCQEPLPPA